MSAEILCTKYYAQYSISCLVCVFLFNCDMKNVYFELVKVNIQHISEGSFSQDYYSYY